VPTYEYECRQCGHRFEKFQSMKDQPLQKCEKCGGELRRLIGTGAGILFKGSGFYQTDYRSESYKKRAQADKPSESKPSTATSDSSKSATSSSSSSSSTTTAPAAPAKSASTSGGNGTA